jgi:hypothetical protein
MISVILDNKLKPAQKWLQLEEIFKPVLPEIKKTLQKLLANIIGYWNIPIKILVNVNIQKIYYLDDLQYFAKLFDLELHQIILINLYYELSACCTTLCTKINDDNVMFRTMDWPMDFLKKITYKATYNNGIDSQYSVISWFGCVGFFTACNPNFAIAINYRREANSGNLLTCIYRTINLHWPSSYLVREIFEKNMSINYAYDLLQNSKIISPVYFTFLPVNDKGSVIQRGINSNTIVKPSSDLCQTNIDVNNSGSNIMWSKERKKYVELVNKKKYKSSDEIFKTIKDFPVINDETLYVSVMCPKLNTIDYRIV